MLIVISLGDYITSIPIVIVIFINNIIAINHLYIYICCQPSYHYHYHYQYHFIPLFTITYHYHCHYYYKPPFVNDIIKPPLVIIINVFIIFNHHWCHPPEVSLGASGVLLLPDGLLLLAPASLGRWNGHGGAQHHGPLRNAKRGMGWGGWWWFTWFFWLVNWWWIHGV